jgi:hypothetical protein
MLSQLFIAFSVPIVVLGILAVVRWRQKMLIQSSKPAQLPVTSIFAWLSLLETFLVATCWCAFVAIDPAQPTDTGTAEFVWADMLEADIQSDQWLARGAPSASVAITNYQRIFALGKLGLLSHQHNLASILSIEPERIKRLRIGLSQADDLSVVQPELDVMLKWLGVEKRLVRTRNRGERASFSWQPISDAKRLCELRCTEPSPSQGATVSWQWRRSGELEIDIDSPSSCRLLVRQFNDGGWRAVSDREAAQSPQLKRDSSGLFVECDIAAGKSKLMLQRIHRPLQLGMAISLASLLCAFGMGYFSLRIASATMSRSK